MADCLLKANSRSILSRAFSARRCVTAIEILFLIISKLASGVLSRQS